MTLLVAVAACGGAWHHCRWSLFARDDLGLFARAGDRPVCVEGVARTGPSPLPAGGERVGVTGYFKGIGTLICPR